MAAMSRSLVLIESSLSIICVTRARLAPVVTDEYRQGIVSKCSWITSDNHQFILFYSRLKFCCAGTVAINIIMYVLEHFAVGAWVHITDVLF